MGKYYYVNKNSGYNDNHVVHASGCSWLPKISQRQFLGTFYSVNAALQQARKFYQGAMACDECCPIMVKKSLPTQNKSALNMMAKF
ncbi:hypothetical protein J9874_01547 [Duffyella gerundensis]|jgi:hypothetical protein|uniref:Uncharacterized protein n=1 Tax=Duffyella gerundensis TaxID=1619313 RepID=A0A0U5L4I2_9GAMM|nr:hypothetical protein [Duffyella gerundensis]QTO55778.1 hypothetical protein J8I88_08000 [Duffyella gerundensis]UCB31015.1 hypothetical protein J9874_01547 [Duffyella gerundensis]CUU24080.1 hypothetical protein EM595_1846 [Duffyella gerundensis]